MTRENIIPRITAQEAEERRGIDQRLLLLEGPGGKTLCRYQGDGIFSIVATIDCDLRDLG